MTLFEDDDIIPNNNPKKENNKKSSHKAFSIFKKRIEHSTKNGEEKEKKLTSFYGENTDEDLFKSDNYYEENEDLIVKRKTNEGKKVFNFGWWEYLILLIELVLIIYTLLVFIGVAPLF